MSRQHPSQPRSRISFRITRILAVLGAIALVAGTGIAGAASASAVSTFTVSGTVPTDFHGVGSVLVVEFAWDTSVDDWVEGPSTTTADIATGAFSLALPISKRYTLGFIADRMPYLPTVLGGLDDLPTSDALGASVFTSSGAAEVLGAVTLTPAYVLQGVVTAPDHTPLADADVFATDADGDEYDTGTRSDGSYYLPVPATSELWTIGVDADDYAETYYPGTDDESAAEQIALSSATVEFDGLDFSAVPTKATLTGDFTHDREAEVYLYKLTGPGGTVTSSVPVGGDNVGDSFFEFDSLPIGDYALGLRDPDTGAWIPWTKYTGNGGGTGGPTSCLLPITVTGEEDIDLGDVTLGGAAGSTCSAPWDPTTTHDYTGHILNMVAGQHVSAWLYVVKDGQFIPVNDATVDDTAGGSLGDFSIPGISGAGVYVVYFEMDSDDSPFLDTWSDGTDATVDPDGDSVASTNPIPGDADYALPGLNLTEAALLTGTVLDSSGHPVAGADVEADQSDLGDYYTDVLTNSSGHYTLRVSPGWDYYLSASASGYRTQYWQDAATENQALSVSVESGGPDPTPYDFTLAASTTSIVGLVIRVDPDSGPLSSFPSLTANLYRHTGGKWKLVTSQTAADFEGLANEFQFPENPSKSLTPGDYRLRFRTPAKWLPLLGYDEADINGDPRLVDGPVCYVSINNVVAHQEREVEAIVDATDTKTKCHAQTNPASSHASSTQPGWVTEALASDFSSADAASTSTPTPTPTVTPSEEPSSSPSLSSSSSPSPAANANTAGADLSWLIWLIAGIVLACIIALIIVMIVRRR
jgi:hypothetical protein